MNFSEIYERYKKGEATESERKEVEGEIRKYALLTEDYLEDDDFGVGEDSGSIELNQMKKLSRRRIFLIVLTSVLATILIITCAVQLYKHVISPLINENIYYNPDQNTYGEYLSDFDAELSVLTDLHLPYQGYGGTTIENTGLGKYDLSIRVYKPGLRSPQVSEGYVNKNKIKINDEFYEFAPMNIFVYSDPLSTSEEEKYISAEYKNQIKSLKELPDNVMVFADVSFSEDVPMEDLMKIIKNNRNLGVSWVGIRGVAKDRQRVPLVGFSPEQTGVVYSELNKKYPEIYMDDFYSDKLSKEMLETHFNSLISFQLDNIDTATKISDVLNKEYYESILKYVKKAGVNSYGIVVSGNPKDILKLAENPEVCYVTSNYVEWTGF